MTIQLRKAERLCTATEFSLVKAAVAPAIRELDSKQLATHVTRARRARDKQRDLLKRQRLDSRERTGQKSGRSGDANARTREKAELFAEVLERFEARVEVVGAGEARGMTGKKAAKKKAAKKVSGKDASTKKATTSKAATKKADTKEKVTKEKTAKKKAIKEAAPQKSAAKKSSKRQSAGEPEQAARKGSRPADRGVKGPAVKTPTERVAEKVRTTHPHTDDHERSGVERQAVDPGVTETHGARFVSDRAKVAAQQAGSHGAREQAIQGHVSSTGRRNQAKRDKR